MGKTNSQVVKHAPKVKVQTNAQRTTMPGMTLLPRTSNGSLSPTTTILIVIFLALKICLLIGFCFWLSKRKQAQRRARGCNCRYYCEPWWYCGNDQLCSCPTANNLDSNMPTIYAQTPSYNVQGLPYTASSAPKMDRAGQAVQLVQTKSEPLRLNARS